MKNTVLRISALISFIGALAPMSLYARDMSKVLYGKDDRYEADEYPDARARNQSNSVAGMVRNWHLSTNPDNPLEFEFPRVTHERDIGVCASERFADQIVLPLCSGFLVAPDILVTAGHCIESQEDCDNYSWAFGFKEGVEALAKKDVYRCSKIIDRDLSESKYKIQDYAVIKLDRPVTDRAPLSFRKHGRPHRGTDLYVIGHPSSLPLKITDGGEVKGWNADEWKNPLITLFKRRFYLQSNLDTYQGNSGSPVFNQRTGEVEGILIEGANDYDEDQDGMCLRSARRSNSKKESEERIFRINKVAALKNL